MNPRDWVNQNSVIVNVLAVLVLIATLSVIIFRSGGGPRGEARRAYYLDVNTNEIFEADFDTFPPVDAPSGSSTDGEAAGVRAYVFTCGECQPDVVGKTPEELESTGMFILFLEKYPPEVKAQYLGPDGQAAPPPIMLGPAIIPGKLVRHVQEDEWFDALTAVGMQIESSYHDACGERLDAVSCLPE